MLDIIFWGIIVIGVLVGAVVAVAKVVEDLDLDNLAARIFSIGALIVGGIIGGVVGFIVSIIVGAIFMLFTPVYESEEVSEVRELEVVNLPYAETTSTANIQPVVTSNGGVGFVPIPSSSSSSREMIKLKVDGRWEELRVKDVAFDVSDDDTYYLETFYRDFSDSWLFWGDYKEKYGHVVYLPEGDLEEEDNNE